MAYAIPNDIANRLGRDLNEVEARIVNARLNDVELLIKARIPDLDDQIVLNKISSDLVVMIESDALLRLIRNPEGYKAETDGNYSYEIDQRVASGRLTILDEEWALLGIRASVFLIVPRLRFPTSTLEGSEQEGWGPDMDDDDTAVWA